MDPKQCRICYEETAPLINPCKCKGSVMYVHEACLLTWFEHHPEREVRCELCTQHYSVVYMYPFEYVFDVDGADYYLYASPYIITALTYITIHSYLTLYSVLTKKWVGNINEFYVPLQYIITAAWFGLFFIRADIQNWGLYWKHYRCVTYLNFLVAYGFTVGLIWTNGFYSAVVANILQPFFFYIHNDIARRINGENRLRIVG